MNGKLNVSFFPKMSTAVSTQSDDYKKPEKLEGLWKQFLDFCFHIFAPQVFSNYDPFAVDQKV
jgi:hypothetical protein